MRRSVFLAKKTTVFTFGWCYSVMIGRWAIFRRSWPPDSRAAATWLYPSPKSVCWQSSPDLPQQWQLSFLFFLPLLKFYHATHFLDKKPEWSDTYLIVRKGKGQFLLSYTFSLSQHPHIFIYKSHSLFLTLSHFLAASSPTHFTPSITHSASVTRKKSHKCL